jgi:thiol-disulfide isomerase/thioredoxin
MIQIKVFGTTPPCANCKRAEVQVRKAAEQFPGQVEVLKLDALGPEADAYGIMSTPMIVINEEVVSIGKVLPAVKLVDILNIALKGA